MDTKHVHAPLALKADAPEGSVRAAFSVFDVVDSDGDVVMASTFTPGQPVAMSAWGHDWGSLAVGKGAIEVQPTAAVFDGAFFLTTTPGRDHYETVKAMGDLQEWSWGFRVLAAEPGTLNGQSVRFIKSAELYEVSPVLIGANRQTQTLAIKARSGFPEHVTAFRTELDDLLTHAKARYDMRADRGRPLGDEAKASLRALASDLLRVRDELEALVMSDPKGAESPQVETLYLDFQRTVARLNGAAV